jgi:hypothetical protein
MKTLGLTSPITTGPAVKTAQAILNGKNIYEHDFLKTAVDGEYGEGTAQAAYRAKYWTGYTLAHLNSSMGRMYGDVIHGYLTGKRRLPADNARRRAERLKAAASPKPLRVKALNKGITQLGYTEGANNSNKFGIWYGWNKVAWCAQFVSWSYKGVGSTVFGKVASGHYAYCPYIVNDARAGRYGLLVVKDPLPGDLVLFNWDGDWDADHVGMFEKWVNKSGGYFQSVEGNTAPDDSGSQSHGGGVFRRGQQPGKDTRKRSQVQVFIRVTR